MATLAVIPSRLGATRLPRKPLRLVAGVPLVVRVWQRVREANCCDRIVVATDSDEVASALHEYGAEVVLTSPTHVSGTDRVAEVVERAEFRRYDVILNVQGDEPFLPKAGIVGVRDLVASGRFALATLAVKAGPDVLERPEVVKVVAADNGAALYFSRAAIPFLRDAQDRFLRDAMVWRHVGLYGYRREALLEWARLAEHPLERVERLEQLRVLAAGMRMGVYLLDSPFPGGVDTEEDLQRVNQLWTNLYAESY